jgi:hypothetical protein
MAYNKREEKELKELDSIKPGYRTRIIETEKGRLLDVREYAEAPNFTGFTRKGIRLKKEEIQKAISVFTEALEELSS